jgi:hypothetical protein
LDHLGKFNSPLLWDVFAISTYLSVSLVWWTGLLPDFAMLRDRAITPFNKEFILFLVLDGVVEQKIGNVLRKFLLFLLV